MKFLTPLIFMFLISISLFGQDKTDVKPQIKLVVNDSIENFKAGIRASALRSVKLVASPDNYMVTEFKISLMRGNREAGSRVFYSNTMDLLHTLMAKPGDRLLVEVQHVMRLNPDKTATDVRFDKIYQVIPIK